MAPAVRGNPVPQMVVVVGCLLLCFCGGKGQSGNAAPVQGKSVSVAYFHTTYRDPTCKKMESLAREALQRSFPEQLAQGKLRIVVYNIDREQNRHFVQDYQLSSRTFVVSKLVNGEQQSWERLDKCYELVGVVEQFQGYIVSAVKTALEL